MEKLAGPQEINIEVVGYRRLLCRSQVRYMTVRARIHHRNSKISPYKRANIVFPENR